MAVSPTTTKRLFTGADVATGAVFSAIGLLAFRPAIDPDVFWHLATGKWIWQNHAIPKADPFSWTTPGRAWIAHEWLTEAIWRVLYRVGGWGALVAFSGVILMATFALVRATARSLGARPTASTAFTALSALAGLHTWNVRPQMISLAFSALFGYWFAKTLSTSPSATRSPSTALSTASSTTSPMASLAMATSQKQLWLIPVIMLAWVNLHGGWVFGMALLGAFAVATLLESILSGAGDDGLLARFFGARRPAPKSLTKATLGIFLCSLIVCFANPNLLKGVVYPFSYLGDNASTRYVNEWFAPSIAKVQYWPFFVLLALFAVIAVTGLQKLPLYVYAIGIPFSFLAVQSARNVSQFAVFVAPHLAVAATNWRRAAKAKAKAKAKGASTGSISSLRSGSTSSTSSLPATPSAPTAPEALAVVDTAGTQGTRVSDDTPIVLTHTNVTKQTANPAAISKINLAAIIALTVASAAFAFGSFTKQANLTAQAKIYPVEAVKVLLSNPGKRLLNDYDWGGYLTHVAPQIPVSIDGRPDMYGDDFTDSYVAMWRGNKGWQARLSALDADRVLAKPKSAIATNLRKSSGWKILFEDSIAVLFSPR
jgi:hypothetical protein